MCIDFRDRDILKDTWDGCLLTTQYYPPFRILKKARLLGSIQTEVAITFKAKKVLLFKVCSILNFPGNVTIFDFKSFPPEVMQSDIYLLKRQSIILVIHLSPLLLCIV